MLVEAIMACALAAPPVAHKNGYSNADQAFFRMLDAMVPGEGFKHGILANGYFAAERSVMVQALLPGGFILISGKYANTRQYFRERDWQMLPFYWHDHMIFRKPLGAAA